MRHCTIINHMQSITKITLTEIKGTIDQNKAQQNGNYKQLMTYFVTGFQS